MNPISENNFKDIMTREVEPALKEMRREDTFTSFDGNEIHYEAYEISDSRAVVIILHGFTESAEKLREVSYYFINNGYSVFAPDLRGHGYSYRTSEKAGTVNCDDFNEYAEDLNCFIEQVVRPAAGDRPVCVYAHSLGCTAAILYMEKHPHIVKKAVLSSPMICGNMGMPVAVAGAVAKLLCALGGGSISAPGRCVFDPRQSFDKSDATSRARFEYYHEKRKAEPLLQTNGPSFSWVRASVKARDSIIANADKLEAELLIILPEEDKQLLRSYQDKFIGKLKAPRVITVADTKHEIFSSESSALCVYYKSIFDFLP